MVRFLRSLDPPVIGRSTSTSVKLFERLLSILLDAKRIPEGDVDSIRREYSLFVIPWFFTKDGKTKSFLTSTERELELLKVY